MRRIPTPKRQRPSGERQTDSIGRIRPIVDGRGERWQSLAPLLMAMAAVLLDPTAAAACPGCKEGLAADLQLGYAASVLVLLAVPAVLVAGWLAFLRSLAAAEGVASPAEVDFLLTGRRDQPEGIASPGPRPSRPPSTPTGAPRAAGRDCIPKSSNENGPWPLTAGGKAILSGRGKVGAPPLLRRIPRP